MGLIVFVILVILEIVLAILTCKIEAGTHRRTRLIIRIIQTAVVMIALLLPFGQKWRFVPSLGLLILLLVIAALRLLIRRNKEARPGKRAGVIVGCIFLILLLGISLVPAFVFTGYKGLPVSGEYQIEETSAILIDSARADPFEQDGSSREVPMHFYYPAAVQGSTEQFPLVLFSHGAFGYYQSNTSTYMELASNGYVVVSMDHPHHAFFTEDTDGKLIIVDRAFLSTAMQLSNESAEENPEETLNLYRDWMSLRTADMEFVLDELELAGKSGALDDSWVPGNTGSDTILSVLNRTDFSRIGLMGHSMGGATSVALGRERDDITAVIDIDGTMLSEYTGVEDGRLTVSEDPYEVPVLEFTNWESYNELESYMEEYRTAGGRYPNDELMRHAAAGFSITIRDTKHMDLTDLPLLSPVLGNMLGSGTRDTAETMTIVNSLVRQFYDCYLKGEGEFTVQEVY